MEKKLSVKQLENIVSLFSIVFDLDEYQLEYLSDLWERYREKPYNCIHLLPIMVKEDLKYGINLYDSLTTLMTFLMIDQFRHLLADRIEKALNYFHVNEIVVKYQKEV